MSMENQQLLTIRAVNQWDSDEWGQVRKLLESSLQGFYPATWVREACNAEAGGALFVGFLECEREKCFKEDIEYGKYNSPRVLAAAVTIRTTIARHGTRLLVRWLAVEKKRQGQGFGKQMVRYLHQYAQNMGCSGIEVLKDENTTRFWTKWGYRTSLILPQSLSLDLCSSESPASSAAGSVTTECGAHSRCQSTKLFIPECVRTGEIVFRPVVASDEKQWKHLIQAGCQYLADSYELRAMIRATLSAKGRFVAVPANSKSEIIALVAIEDASGWIPFITTRAKDQNRGIGTFLLTIAMEWVRRSGGNCIQLRPLTTKVCPFYENRSFSVQKQEKKDDDGGALVGMKRKRTSNKQDRNSKKDKEFTRAFSTRKGCLLPPGLSFSVVVSGEPFTDDIIAPASLSCDLANTPPRTEKEELVQLRHVEVDMKATQKK